MNANRAAMLLACLALLASCRPQPEWGGAGAICEDELDCGRIFSCVDGVCVADEDVVADAGMDAADAAPVEDAEEGADTSAPDMAPDTAPDLGACGGTCASPDVCNPATGECVDCLVNEDCADGVCDTATNSCVGCLADTDCTDPTASACDATTNTCTGCADSTQCAHLAATGTGVCDAAGSTCVQCTGTEYSACNGVCDSRLHTCTDLPAGELGLCQACVSDAQCRPGMYCVPMTYDAADGSGEAEVGTFCLWDIASTEPNAPAGACSTVRPYVAARDVTTIDGASVTVCGLNRATCPALKDFTTACPTAGMNDDCGAPGFDDGLCVVFDAASNQCTTLCLGDNDCKTGSSCDDTVTPNRCTLTTN